MIPGTPLLAILEITDADIRAMGILIYDGIPEGPNTRQGLVSTYNPKKNDLLAGSVYGLMTLDRRYIDPNSMVDLKWDRVIDPCLWVMGDFSVVIAPTPGGSLAEHVVAETRRNVASAIWLYRRFKGQRTDDLEIPIAPPGEI